MVKFSLNFEMVMIMSVVKRQGVKYGYSFSPLQVEGTYYPYPRCEFEVQITEYIAYSTPIELTNTALGDLPGGLGEDLVTFLPKITLTGPGYYDASLPSLVVSISEIILDGDSGCVFIQ